ncbi:MAG: 4Fe-4S binding protein [Fibrobacteres bacterium]|nr:4Fe-4S binding protein [Fibrobacterota bacterium]
MAKTKLHFKADKCDYCGSCVAVCEPDALLLTDTAMFINHDKCIRCGRCTTICPFRALTLEEI